MIKIILHAAILVILTSIVHLIVTSWAMGFINNARTPKKTPHLRRLLLLDGIVMLILTATILEAIIWASWYFGFGVISGFEEAVYFSLVTYTTLGYGDITLEPGWRILASIQAAQGIIMFGWSTAIVMAALQKIYFKKN